MGGLKNQVTVVLIPDHYFVVSSGKQIDNLPLFIPMISCRSCGVRALGSRFGGGLLTMTGLALITMKISRLESY